eukprot:scaffold630365_cov15-Prasinocladus_malaysianus.AAC.1
MVGPNLEWLMHKLQHLLMALKDCRSCRISSHQRRPEAFWHAKDNSNQPFNDKKRSIPATKSGA